MAAHQDESGTPEAAVPGAAAGASGAPATPPAAGTAAPGQSGSFADAGQPGVAGQGGVPAAGAVAPNPGVVPPGHAAVPPGHAAVPPGHAAVPPEQGVASAGPPAIPPSQAIAPPSHAGAPAHPPAVPPQASAVPPQASAVPPQPPAVPPQASVVPPHPAHMPAGQVSPQGAPVPCGPAAVAGQAGVPAKHVVPPTPSPTPPPVASSVAGVGQATVPNPGVPAQPVPPGQAIAPDQVVAPAAPNPPADAAAPGHPRAPVQVAGPGQPGAPPMVQPQPSHPPTVPAAAPGAAVGPAVPAEGVVAPPLPAAPAPTSPLPAVPSTTGLAGEVPGQQPMVPLGAGAVESAPGHPAAPPPAAVPPAPVPVHAPAPAAPSAAAPMVPGAAVPVPTPTAATVPTPTPPAAGVGGPAGGEQPQVVTAPVGAQAVRPALNSDLPSPVAATPAPPPATGLTPGPANVDAEQGSAGVAAAASSTVPAPAASPPASPAPAPAPAPAFAPAAADAAAAATAAAAPPTVPVPGAQPEPVAIGAMTAEAQSVPPAPGGADTHGGAEVEVAPLAHGGAEAAPLAEGFAAQATPPAVPSVSTPTDSPVPIAASGPAPAVATTPPPAPAPAPTPTPTPTPTVGALTEASPEVPAPANPQIDPSQLVDDNVARLLLESGLISAERLTYAKRVISKLTVRRSLTQTMLELGTISREQLRAVLQANRDQLKTGSLLIELGYLSPGDWALAKQIRGELYDEDKKLEEILVEHHLVEENRLLDMFNLELGYPARDAEFSKLHRQSMAKIPVQWLSKHRFVPVALEEGRVVVAFADPLDRIDREAAEKVYGQSLEVAVGGATTIRNSISLFRREVTGSKTQDEDIVRLVDDLLKQAWESGSSDIHLEPLRDRMRVRMRRDGVLVHHRDIPRDLMQGVTSRIKVLAEADIAERRRHQDGRIYIEDKEHGYALDLRVSFYVTVHGEKIVMRLLNKTDKPLTVDAIGMARPMLDKFVECALEPPSGVLIVTGPTGSGKTTTLYSCVNYLSNMENAIATVEDPVEYVVEGIAQCSINPKIEVTFSESLRHILRQDPDIIVLGEVRDNLSAEATIQAALTGHKVLTTLHTEDSIGGIMRLLNMNIEAFLLSSTVLCVVAQRLLRRVCKDCAVPYTPTPMDQRALRASAETLAGGQFVMGRGCASCRFSGYKGRVGVYELLVLNEMVRDAILSHCTASEIRRISVQHSGLVTLLEDGLVKAANGLTSLHEVAQRLPRLDQPRALKDLRRLLGG